jgi:hypothetical protein
MEKKMRAKKLMVIFMTLAVISFAYDNHRISRELNKVRNEKQTLEIKHDNLIDSCYKIVDNQFVLTDRVVRALRICEQRDIDIDIDTCMKMNGMPPFGHSKEEKEKMEEMVFHNFKLIGKAMKKVFGEKKK